MNAPSDAPPPGRFPRTRLLSLAALAASALAVAWVIGTIYRVATDSFVAPIVLSPDSDMVIQSKLSLAQLLAERSRITAAREELEGEDQAAAAAIAELTGLGATAARGLEFTASVKASQATAGGDDLQALDRQRAVVQAMIAEQEALVARMARDLELGVVSRSEYAFQSQALSRMRVELIDNQRAQLMTEVHLGEVQLTRAAMRGAGGRGLSTPEMLMQRDQLVRIRCELLKLEAERRSNRAQRRHIDEELAKIDELIAQLKARPIFRATEASTNVAFVPYTQIDGVARGAPIYDCVWGLLACTRVGHVDELLPGEVIVPDPWGTPARGQYAIMSLSDQHAARSRTLRVRPLAAADREALARGPQAR